jgi:glutamate synthase (NADPH/NADH) small chain
LNIPGRQSPRVVLALDYLRLAGQSSSASKAGAQAGAGQAHCLAGQTVAVIGGGETGNDCVETALRQGARQVHQLEILHEPALADGDGRGTDPRGIRPYDSLQRALAQAEARAKVIRHWGVSTRELANNGAGLLLRGCRVAWLPSSGSAAGKRPVELAGTEFELNVDLVVLALGFDALIDEHLAGQLGAALDERGRLVLNDYATSTPNCFAAGDLVSGPSLLAKAIFAGRQAAERIDRFLRPAPVRDGAAQEDVE